ncbi:hypothetical protein CAS74_004087 [Pichia kudriavzevii]|uniref:Alpha-1,2-mannosyltransferase MNN2 n=1 Tax=Pichia kudriavzevii TaxID=4909 RepID=A0A099NYW9_PICKU|nr:hypothetical protein JL09_g2885 [Pichia kudriavzevii]ONH71155.1 hypothetical protein BOH78_4647 [Pichia kudriavzevii]OUT21088.1 hypothetical protein CAS74_004087 [Pichia kudriavzevii]
MSVRINRLFKGKTGIVTIVVTTLIFLLIGISSRNDYSLETSYQNAQSIHSLVKEKSSNYWNSLRTSADVKEALHTELNDEVRKLNKVNSLSFLKGSGIIHEFFGNFFDKLHEFKSSYPLKRRMTLDEKGRPHIDVVHFFASEQDDLSEEKLLDLFDYPPEFIDDLTFKHSKVVEQLPDFKPKFYSGDGYAIVGGGKFSWYSFLAVKSLREVGAKLPIEIILPTAEDYEELLCDKLLPELNARCVQMETVFGVENIKKLSLTGYQLKGLALLSSSFENVFLLDSDSYAVSNPEPIFRSKLYSKYNMITWPDFWRRTTSPLYYKIAGIEVPEDPVRHINDVYTNVNHMDLNKGKSRIDIDPKKDYQFHDRPNTLMDWTTESGEMLINKSVHFKTLLLALYYNFDGPYGYHPLLSQGGAGEGDKETFVAAANYFKLPYYQVYKRPDKAMGFWNIFNTFEHGAIVQYDPLKDYENVQKIISKIEADMGNTDSGDYHYDYEKYFQNGLSVEDSIPMFYHCHDPKFDPFYLINEKKMFVRDEDNKETDTRRRILGADFPRGDIDLELSLWEIANSYICEKGLQFPIFNGNDYKQFCHVDVPEQLDFLKKSNQYIVKHYDPSTGNKNLESSNNLFEVPADST